MSKRKIVDVEVNAYVGFSDFDGKTPDEIIKNMEELKAGNPGRDIYFNIQSYGYDGGKEMTLRERREENDKEYNKRIAEEKKEKDAKKQAKANKDAKEFLEYQRLQKKFQGKTVF